MDAAVITEAGAPPRPLERPDPAPGDGEALIRVHAAAIAPLDLLCASGASYFGTPATPYVPGVQGVGEVVTAPTLPSGTRVWFPTTAGMAPGDGSMARLSVAKEEGLLPLPDGAGDALVAALGLSAVAAWAVLTQRAGLRPGEVVLVLGGGGVVGQVAIQAARVLGAGRVVAAARSEAARRRCENAGADVVVDLRADEARADLALRLLEACGRPVDVVVDPLCGDPGTAAASILAEGGRLVNLGSSAGPTSAYDSALLRSRSAEILGYTNNALAPARQRELLAEVLEHAVAGAITVAHELVPLSDVTDAWTRQAQGRCDGRIVLTP
ncbi:zinc-binding alcohol dehydrogenase family protein [Occultella glacieicola]|uniref:Zinc-binding alcohol dehydrogenase family protein n=1 Tax=Occultella glacieicola TaxID=2518684 RepID=A0ABY2E627_9MICO|nr:zinc-binding alcohol dehydrogenase family protein [Occultella glacieicola]TDE94956.1 zinc-binding alcohol dehydrogenase family protein [Occultella glacieicola]